MSRELRRYAPEEEVIYGHVIDPPRKKFRPAENFPPDPRITPPIPPKKPKEKTDYEKYFEGSWRPCESVKAPEQRVVVLGFWASLFFLITGLKPHE